MNIVFIKEYLTYKIGFELKNIDKLNSQRLIGLGVCEEKKTRKKKSKEV
jgi:hypothetical protein